ncbi:MAG: aminotransferase class V-fold PLP-dependent enzyme [Saprospiraceae bacterium]|nr:aminotransferase class V-fold PLP-dependent enzyme [Saprospiraceae bacterium]
MLNRRKILKLLPKLPFGGLLAAEIIPRLGSMPQNRSWDQTIYESIGVRSLINARGTVTIVGATRMLPEVQEAMDAATRHYVQLDELMEGVGQKLAQLTGAEWGCVTSGASAAITLATIGSITRGDPDRLWQIPDLTGLKDEVIIPSYSRTAYECAARAVGVKMIEVSNAQELESALGPRTAMILVLTGAQSAHGPLSITKISALARPMGIPILADAAAEELLVPNPHLTQGADLVAYSGGKCLRGPQCAGLLLGRKDLVQSAWIAGAPHHGFGRGQKVGREEIMGMLAAVEMWFKRDHLAERSIWNQWLNHISGRLESVSGVKTVVSQPGDQLSNRFPSLHVSWDMTPIPLTGFDVENLLWESNPRIAVSGAGSFLPFPANMQPNIRINPSQLKAGEEKIIAEALYTILSKPPVLQKPQGAPAIDISGQWDVLMQFAASEVQQTFIFEQNGSEIIGTHIASYASRDLSGSLYGDQILIRSPYSQDGVRLNFEFTGTVNERSMEGEASLGEYGVARWSARRHQYDNPAKK